MTPFFRLHHDSAGYKRRVHIKSFKILDRRSTTHFDNATGIVFPNDINTDIQDVTPDQSVALVRYEYNRHIWPDLMYNSVSRIPLIVSDRVHQVLKEERVEWFKALPIERADDNLGLASGETLPKYWAIYSRVGLETKLGTRASALVNIKGPASAEEARQRFIPIIESWTGTDLFILKEDGLAHYPQLGEPTRATGFHYGCTERILHLVHEHHWTGFRFDPVDKRTDLIWFIDPLAKEWPPASWYPRSPGEGKSFEEWLAIAEDPRQNWQDRSAAGLAIRCDFSDVAAEYYVQQFLHSPDPQVHLRAAHKICILSRLTGTFTIPSDILKQATSVVQVERGTS